MCHVEMSDGSRVRVGTLFCIGRNYAAHARELDNPVPERPVVFLKPQTALLGDGGSIPLPAASDDVQHEVEMVLLLGAGGKHLQPEQAMACIAAYAVGIDVTARDIQQRAKRHAYPWTVGKGFDGFAPVGRFIPAEQVPHPESLALRLAVNGRLRQSGCVRDMLFPVPQLLAYLSSVFTLRAGDLVFTGTPEGVRRFQAGDYLHAELVDAEGTMLAGLDVDAHPEPHGL